MRGRGGGRGKSSEAEESSGSPGNIFFKPRKTCFFQCFFTWEDMELLRFVFCLVVSDFGFKSNVIVFSQPLTEV